MSTLPEARKCLFDIIEAGREIQAYTYAITCSDFAASSMIQAAVERKFEIIGEALNRIGRLDQAVLTGISGHQRIIGFRNVIAHGYDAVDSEMVWDAVENHLPKLLADARRLLEA